MSKLKLPQDHPYIKGRTCTSCGEYKSVEYFSLEKDKRSVGGITIRSKCKPCNEFIKYKAFMKRRYGITYQEYCDLIDHQNGKCAICEASDAQNNRTSGRLFIDHCHTTGKVRGLLCSKCNHAIGQLNDDIELLKKAIKYLTVQQEA